MKIKREMAPYAVLIPSKGRPEVLLKTLRAMPFLDRSSTFIGVENKEKKAYTKVRKKFPHIVWITYDNEVGSGTFAREQLRQEAVSVGFKRYVLSDDNTRFSKESLDNLVQASFIYPTQPCIVAGMHGTAAHFDSSRIKKSAEKYADGRKGRTVLHFYRKRSAMFWAIPHVLYSKMEYTIDEGCMDDVQVTFAAYDRGITAQVICMDAPFQKKRYAPGGYGGIGERVRKVGIAVQRFARTHPQYMEKVRVTFPWTQIEKGLRDA
jgi:hypothetical protein